MLDGLDFLGLGAEGTPKMRVVGAILGGLVGAFLGFILSVASVQTTAMWVMFTYAAVGTVIGAVIGAIFALFMIVIFIIVVCGGLWGFAKFVVGM